MGLFTTGGMPLTVREFAFMTAEASMTIWMTMYGVPVSRLDEGMALVRLNVATELEQYRALALAPSMIDPISDGVRAAEDPLQRDLMFEGYECRDFDAIVGATTKAALSAAYAASKTAPIEEFIKQISNVVRTDEGPRSE